MPEFSPFKARLERYRIDDDLDQVSEAAHLGFKVGGAAGPSPVGFFTHTKAAWIFALSIAPTRAVLIIQRLVRA